jgi:protein-tyrosine phosphatase
MVDIHCHILPGIDDGADSVETSLAMAEAAIADGITHVVATPHADSQYRFEYDRVRGLRHELQAKVAGRLTVATGCDFHLNPENFDALRANPKPFCINQEDYLLVEFNEFSIPPAMDQTLHEIQLLGLRPIVTHPERNAILRVQPERLAKWVRLGCFVQITAGSLTGVFGQGPHDDAWRWLAQGLVHFVASDAHNLRGRPLKLAAACAEVRKQAGTEVAEALFSGNPMAAFEGRELPFVPQPEEEQARPARKRFFFF